MNQPYVQALAHVRAAAIGQYHPVCDILLHSRGDLKDDNLIAVEMRKDYASDERKQSDRERLQALTPPLPENGNPDCVCGYQIGYYLEIHIGNGTLLIE